MVSHVSQASQRAGPDDAAGMLALQSGPRDPGSPHIAAAVEAARTGDPGPAVCHPEPPGCPALPHSAGGGWAST